MVMSEPRPHEIPHLKSMIIEACIALLNVDIVGGGFAIQHAYHVGFGDPSSRVLPQDQMGYARTMIEAIQLLRWESPNAKLIVDDAVRIAYHAVLTPRRQPRVA
jgi:hypothetical protein